MFRIFKIVLNYDLVFFHDMKMWHVNMKNGLVGPAMDLISVDF